MNPLLTTAETAKLLMITPARVRQLIAEGRLGATKPGRDHVVRIEDIKKYQAAPATRIGRPKKYLRMRKKG
jgi:excisionase family DNA binding protein